MTIGAVTVVPATPSHAGAIVDTMRGCFEPWVVDRTIYGCPGITGYVERVIHAAPLGSTAYWVALSDAEVVGFAEFRRRPSELLLAYIGSRPTARRRGVAGRLLAGPLHDDGVQQVALDVFEDNHTAARWYDRLGFTGDQVMGWWEAGLPRTGGGMGAPARVTGLPQADACHRAFGFSELVVESAHGSYRVGRLGDQWWRVFDPALLRDHEAVAALGALDERRRVVVLGSLSHPDTVRLGPPAKRILHLAVSVDILRRRLTHAGG